MIKSSCLNRHATVSGQLFNWRRDFCANGNVTFPTFERKDFHDNGDGLVLVDLQWHLEVYWVRLHLFAVDDGVELLAVERDGEAVLLGDRYV